jgi:hypothetical protein
MHILLAKQRGKTALVLAIPEQSESHYNMTYLLFIDVEEPFTAVATRRSARIPPFSLFLSSHIA